MQQGFLKAHIPTLREGDDARTFQEELKSLGNGTHDTRNNRQAMVDNLWRSSWKPTENLTTNGRELLPPGRESDQATLDSLSYKAISHREEAIPPAHKSTFEWIFTGNQEGQWDSFPQWLMGTRRENYWITGKPGSGKSTLMKFIASSEKFKRLVAAWSGNTPYVIATFFSWQAGVELQRSSAGFVRSLLSQCIVKEPYLARRCCARRWSIYEIFGFDIELPEWTQKELRQSLDVLLYRRSESTGPSAANAAQQLNIVLLVDGLDEFSGDHNELVSLIKDISRLEGVRVCVSSRPWNIFSDAYARTPSLRLEDLTRGDILKFVRSSFESHSGFLDLGAVFPAEAERLMNSVVEKAAGVFLWVSIVGQLLLAGLTDGDKISDLQAALNQVPGDLENLYEGIWGTVEDTYKVQGVQFFLLFNASKEIPFTAPLLWLADEPAPHDLCLTTMDIEKISTVMKRRLASRTKGLLELSARGNVQYIHRTAYDWVLRVLPDISVNLPSDFIAALEVLKAFSCAASIRPLSNQSERLVPLDFSLVRICLALAFEAAAAKTEESVHRLTTYLDFLERQMPSPALVINRCQHMGRLNEIGFSALAASYELWSYLRERVIRNPTKAVAHVGDITFLEATIFPNSCVEGLRTSSQAKRIPAGDEALSRLTMLKFLLDAGASKTELCHSGNTLQQKLQIVYGTRSGYGRAALDVLNGKTLRISKPEIQETVLVVQPRISEPTNVPVNENETKPLEFPPEGTQQRVRKRKFLFRLAWWRHRIKL